jgi:hypothetical protein
MSSEAFQPQSEKSVPRLVPSGLVVRIRETEEAGLEEAARSLDAGEGLSLDEVKRRLQGLLRR